MVSFFLDVTPREKAFLGWLGRPKEKRVDEIVAGLAGLVKLFSPRTEELLSNIRGSIWHQTVPRPSVSMGFRKMFRERDMLPGKLHLSLSFNWIFVSLVLARIHPFWNVKHDLAVIEFSHRLRYDRTIQVRKSEKKESGITASISIFGCHSEFIVWLSFWPLARVPSRVICSPLFSLSFFLLRIRIRFSRPFSLLRTRVFKLCVPIVVCSRNVSLSRTKGRFQRVVTKRSIV